MVTLSAVSYLKPDLLPEFLANYMDDFSEAMEDFSIEVRKNNRESETIH
jgi:hypothetical protein